MFVEGGKQAEIAVKPHIAASDLFQHIKEKSGFGDAMRLEQFDADIKNWVDVTAEDVEPGDGAKFRVVS